MMVMPSRWQRGRIKWDTDMVAGATPSTEEDGFWLEGDDPSGTPFVGIADMSRRERVSVTAKSLSPDGLRSRTMPLGRPGTLLFAMYASVGEVAFLDLHATWNQAILGITPHSDQVDSRFLRYVLLDMRDDLLRDARSNTQSNLNASQVGDIWFQKPALVEQGIIADYLDREIARIDTMVDEQRSLLEMLHERRLAVITELVVGSSIADRIPFDSMWYPDLPVGWRRGRVKSIAARVTDGAHISPETDGGVFDFVSTRDINGGLIDFEKALKTTSESYEYMVRTGCQPQDGDVLFSKDGTVGEAAVVRGDHPFVVASSLVIVSPNRGRISSDYLAYVFASKTVRDQAASLMRGAGLPRLSVGNLARLEIPIPPRSEQCCIVALLDKQTAKIDELIAETGLFIKLARERRAALITAAVTGQIDVREAA